MTASSSVASRGSPGTTDKLVDPKTRRPVLDLDPEQPLRRAREVCAYTPHSLRATTATLLLDAGVEIGKARELEFDIPFASIFRDLMNRLFPLDVTLNQRLRSYWASSANRRSFLDLLGSKLGYHEIEDWYQITGNALRAAGGAGLLKRYHDSPTAAVMDNLPAHDWKEWLFPRVPKNFWQRPDSCRRYLDWLGAKVGFIDPDDWYRVKGRHFSENNGSSLLQKYSSCPAAAVMAGFSDCKWFEWRFLSTPVGFWGKVSNHREYLSWLAARLGFDGIDDWYRVTSEDFIRNYGCGLLNLYDGSPSAVIRDAYPDREWLPWLFSSAPQGFWSTRANRRRYLDWLGKQRGNRSLDDWHTLTLREIQINHGRGLLDHFKNSAAAAIHDTYAEHHWS